MENELAEQIIATATAWDGAAICGVRLPARAGQKFKVPWREDRRPSASIMTDGRRILDWSTGESEDAAGLVGRVMGVAFPMAVNLLGVRLGMGEPFPDGPGMGRSRLILPGLADYAEPAELEPSPAVAESAGIANFSKVSDAAADKYLRNVCEHLAGDVELATEIATWRGLPVALVQRLAREGRLGSCGRNVWLPCKQEGGLWVRAQVRKIGPREAGCEYFWPKESNHKPGLWTAAEGGGRVVVAEGWGDAAAGLAMLEGEPVTVVATLGTGARKLEGLIAESAMLLRQHDKGDANQRWARSIRALWPSISVKSLLPPFGVKDWNDMLKGHGLEGARRLLVAGMTVPDDEAVAMTPDMAGRRFQALNESMASEVFIDLVAGDLLHDDTLTNEGDWYAWKGTHWQRGALKAAMERAKEVQEVLRREAQGAPRQRPLRRDGQPDERHRTANELMEGFASRMGESRGIKNFMGLASSDPRVAARFAEVSYDPFLLPCLNGVFDLGLRGGFREARRDDMITRRIGVAFDEDASCPVWLRTLDSIFEGDREKTAFVQRWFGYCLTGCIQEQKLLFLYGTGANGKSTICEMLVALLGELGISVPQETVVLNKLGKDVPDYEMIRLRGVRVALAPEIDKDAKLNEARVKSLTGGDTMRGRAHYAMSLEFLPTHKLIFYGNHKPLVRGGDDGIWRRFIMMHLRMKFEGKAKDMVLKSKLMAELSGILNWAIAGCWDWQRKGLAVPQSLLDEVIDYRENSDQLGSFLAENVQPMVGMVIMLKDLREKVITWARDAGESWVAENMSTQRLRRELEDRGWKVGKGGKTKMPFINAMWRDEDEVLEEGKS